jgi:arginase
MADRFILTPYFLDEALPGLERLREPGWQVIKPELPEGTTQDRISVLHQDIALKVEGCLASGDRPVSIAGDCCTAIGVTAGIQRAGLNHLVVWLDAHGDFNTVETSPSGFLGGMPLAMLVGRGEQSLLEALEMTSMPEDRIVFSDGRDLDPFEREAMEGSGLIRLSNVDDLLTYDFPDLPLHVHFDTDILDPETAPAMNYLAPGGPDLIQLERIFRHLARSTRIAAISLSSWNPALDPEGKTMAACMEALDELRSS